MLTSKQQRNCMLKAAQDAIAAGRTPSSDICAPQDPVVAEAVATCVQGVCKVKELLCKSMVSS